MYIYEIFYVQKIDVEELLSLNLFHLINQGKTSSELQFLRQITSLIQYPAATRKVLAKKYSQLFFSIFSETR